MERNKEINKEILFLLGVLGVLVFVFFTVNILNPEYKITKEVCHNETITSLDFPDDFEVMSCPEFINMTNGNCYINNASGYIILQEGNNYTRYKQVDYVVNLSKKVCVDEEIQNNTMYFCDKNPSGENCANINLNKDLREPIKWLNINCMPYECGICFHGDDIKHNEERYYAGNGTICIEEGDECREILKENNKWICGEYQVERLK